MNQKNLIDLRNREKRIFFIYKYYLLNFTSDEIDKELHQNLDEFNFTLNQQNTIKKIIEEIENLENIAKEKSENWRWERIDYLDKAILINGIAEIKLFKNKKSIIINESVIFSKKYCNIDSYKFINGILDKIDE